MANASAPIPASETGPVTDETNVGTVDSPVDEDTNTGAKKSEKSEPKKDSDPKTLSELAAADPESFFNPGRVSK